MNIDAYFSATIPLIEQTLNELIPEQNHTYSSLFQSARYSLLNGGKRLRPVLTLATAETFKVSPKNALSTACALEMIHTYSLIHDDLPCMDDDDFRRGKPSLHKAFNEGLAVLAGDYLLTHAFGIIANDSLLNAGQKVALISLISKNAGCRGMIAGQVMDIEAENKTTSLAALQEIHQYKTGALMTASVLAGGIIANASSQELDILRHFGNDMGLAFQIIDDVIDVTESESKHGKKTGSDAANNKATYVTLLGIDGAEKEAQQLLQRALESLSKLPHATSLLQAIARRLIHRNT